MSHERMTHNSNISAFTPFPPVLVTLLLVCRRSFNSRHLDLDEVAGCKAGTDTGTARPPVAGDPVTPHLVHFRLPGHVREVDKSFNDVVLVGTGFFQVGFNLLQRCARLLRNRRSPRGRDRPHQAIVRHGLAAAPGRTRNSSDAHDFS